MPTEAALARLARAPSTLVHGDFHHHNLLRHGDRWLAIDPKPALGEPEYDVPPFLWNPIGGVQIEGNLLGRVQWSSVGRQSRPPSG